ncbi:unnamed protein product [Coregonus sp. 'balchen']|nr:unnamed protein product [Coregonus sp. 'balchen']
MWSPQPLNVADILLDNGHAGSESGVRAAPGTASCRFNPLIWGKLMKHRRLLLSLPHLPTITETLEDSETLGVPGHPAHLAQSVSQSPSQCSQSLEEYMTSIQALARPVAHPSCGPVRLQRMGRPRLFSKPQMKHSVSASLPRGSPRAIRTRTTSPITPTGQAPEQLSGRLGKEREFGEGEGQFVPGRVVEKRTSEPVCVNPKGPLGKQLLRCWKKARAGGVDVRKCLKRKRRGQGKQRKLRVKI